MMKRILCFLLNHNPKPPNPEFVGTNKYIGITKCYRCGGDVEIKYWKSKIMGLDVVEYKLNNPRHKQGK